MYGLCKRRINHWMRILQEEEGSFTVEAAFLVPLTCFLAFAVMMISLYLCDLNQTKSFLNRRVMELSGDGEPYRTEEMIADRQQLADSLFLARIKEFSLIKSSLRVEGKVEVQMRISMPVVSQWMGNIWRNEYSLSVPVGDEESLMRRWSQIE